MNLISHQPDIDKTYLYAKDLYEAKYQLQINKRANRGLKSLNDSKAFIEYSNDRDDIYNKIEEYNPNKKRKILIVVDDMTADMLSNKKLNPIVTELFIRGRKLNISIVLITQSYFAVPKNITLNSTHYFVMEIQTNKCFNKSHLIIHQILTLKTSKTIEDQGEKQIKAIEEHGKQLFESSELDSEESYETLFKQKQIFDKLTNERMDEINKLIMKQVNYDDLTYSFKKKKSSKKIYRL